MHHRDTGGSVFVFSHLTSSTRISSLLLPHRADEIINTEKEDLVQRVKDITGGRGAYSAIDPVGGTTTGKVHFWISSNLVHSHRPISYVLRSGRSLSLIPRVVPYLKHIALLARSCARTDTCKTTAGWQAAGCSQGLLGTAGGCVSAQVGCHHRVRRAGGRQGGAAHHGPAAVEVRRDEFATLWWSRHPALYQVVLFPDRSMMCVQCRGGRSFIFVTWFDAGSTAAADC